MIDSNSYSSRIKLINSLIVWLKPDNHVVDLDWKFQELNSKTFSVNSDFQLLLLFIVYGDKCDLITIVFIIG